MKIPNRNIVSCITLLLSVVVAGLGYSQDQKSNGDYWVEVEGLPAPRHAITVGELNRRLYVMGGCDEYGRRMTNVFCFDGKSWKEIEGLPRPRVSASAGAMNNTLYLVGGILAKHAYSFNGKQWDDIAGPPVEWFMDHGGRASLGVANFNNSLYAIGGSGMIAAHSNVYRFNGDQWEEVTGLPEPRAGLSAGVFNDKLYVVGGGKEPNEYYFDGTDWKKSPAFPVSREEICVAVLDDGLYAMSHYGGYAATNTPVYRFNGTNWTEVASIPIKRPAALGVLNGVLYSIGGYDYDAKLTMTNVYKYVPARQ